MNLPIRVLIAEGQAVVRAGLASTLAGEPDISICAWAKDGVEAIQYGGWLHPDVFLSEVYLPRLSGLTVAAALKRRLPGIKVLFLTFSEKEEDYQSALALGVQGYIAKCCDPAEIPAALREIADGGRVFRPCFERQPCFAIPTKTEK